MKKKICIITGDPNSINSEIISKSLKKLDPKTRSEIILIGMSRYSSIYEINFFNRTFVRQKSHTMLITKLAS